MKREPEEPADILKAALAAALCAGEEILRVYSSADFHIQQKSDQSPITLADTRAHAVIQQQLAHSGLALLSEEGEAVLFEERRNWEDYWLVDPLDGTKEFIKRNGEFTVNIALMRRVAGRQASANQAEPRGGSHRPAAGLVYAPAKKRLYLGIAAGPEARRGAWRFELGVEAGRDRPGLDEIMRDGHKLPATGPAPISAERPLTVIVSRHHPSREADELLAALERRVGPLRRVSGGSSLKLCRVAEGGADLYPRFAPTIEWDTAAGEAICGAAACRVTRRDGQTPLYYNKLNLENPWFMVQGPRVQALVPGILQ